MLDFIWARHNHPRSAIVNPYKSRVDPIYSFGDIALKLPIRVVISATHAQNKG